MIGIGRRALAGTRAGGSAPSRRRRRPARRRTRSRPGSWSITHGQAADPYWSVVKNGVDAAAKTQGVKAEYLAPETFDMVQMAQLIDAAVASKPDGLVVSIPDADAPRAVGEERGRGRHPGDRDRFGRRQADPRAGRPALSRASPSTRPASPAGERGGQARRQEGGLPQPGSRQRQPRRPLRRLRQGPGRRSAGGGRRRWTRPR